MTDEMIALSRRAVACKGWRWMPGMLTTQGERVVGESREAWGTRLWGSLLGADSSGGVFVRSFCDSSGSCLPDLTDPATLGCLLALVREAWGCAVITSPDYDEDDEGCQGHHIVGWRAVDTERWVIVGEGATEAEALVAALESAT